MFITAILYLIVCYVVPCFNILRPIQNGCYFLDDIFKWIFLNENVWILIKVSLKFVLWGPINNIPALIQIMAWRHSGDKPLYEPMMVNFTDANMRHSASTAPACIPMTSIVLSFQVQKLKHNQTFLNQTPCSIIFVVFINDMTNTH